MNVLGLSTFNDVDISGNLVALFQSTFNDVDISGNFIVLGQSTFNDVDISGNLNVLGLSTFNDVDISGNLIALFQSSFNSVDISGNLILNTNNIHLGINSGSTNQGSNSIAIGAFAGQNNQASNSICINATGVNLDALTSNALFISPIAQSSQTTDLLVYNTTTGEITSNNTGKTFIIPHPNDDSKYLVHACLEGPEAGVYYRGINSITNCINCKITLPNYVKKIATDFTVQVTPIYNGKIIQLAVSKVESNEFTVYGDNCEFYWNVYGKRFDIDVEPNINNTNINGSGPYKWIC